MKTALLATLTLLAQTSLAADSLRDQIEQIRVKNGLPALGAGVITPGSASVYMTGNRKQGDATPAEWGDKFHLGSDTKAMTATLLAVQVERGQMRWTSTLEELLPSLARKMHPSFKKATLEMLTSHHAGVEFDGSLHKEDAELWSQLWNPQLDVSVGRLRVAELTLSRAPKYEPGKGYRYDNANYIIAGAILEQASGQKWETLMRTELFRPLGMEGCGFGMAGDSSTPHPTQPWGHKEQPDASLRPVFGDNPATLGPAGTVHCPMHAWLKFVQLHIDGANGRSRTVLLNKASFAKLHEPYPGHNYTVGGWGRATRSWGGTVYTHTGSNTSNLAVVWFSPEKEIGIVGVTNYAGKTASGAVDAAIGLLIRENPRN